MRKNDRRSGLIVGLAVLLAVVVAGPIPGLWAAEEAVLSGLDRTTDTLNDPRTEALRDWLKGVVATDEVPGAALLVAQGGRVLFREACGLADVAKQKPFSPETVVLTASTTKPLSATGVMALVGQGRLSLDDKVSKYLPAFDRLEPAEQGQAAGSPTIRQLLSHTSGLFGLVGATEQGMRAVRDFSLTLAESVDIVAAEKLAAEPGSKFNYGGANYQVAARIVELVSGQPFDRFLGDHLFGPLNMAGTCFKPGPQQSSAAVAMPYTYKTEKGLIPIAAYLPDPDRKLILASGGLYSDLNDLAVFLQMHLNGGGYGPARVLAPASVAEMQTRQTGPAKAPYGLGWFLEGIDDQDRAHTVNHPGLFGSVIWIDRDRDLIGVFLTSSLWPGRQKLNREVMDKAGELFPGGS